MTIRSSKERAANLSGLPSPSGKLRCYATEGTINSDYTIGCLDEAAGGITGDTVIVMDNASWQNCYQDHGKATGMGGKRPFPVFLPVYAPHLNMIETLWRKINRVACRHEWLRPWHYEDAATLEQAVFNIVQKYSAEFSINFSKNFN